MLSRSCDSFRGELKRKSMQYHVNEFLDILLGKACFKNVLVELHEAKRDPLKKEIQIKNRSLSFVVYKQFVLWIYQILGKGNMKLLPSYFFCGRLGSIIQKQLSSIFFIMTAKEID